VPSRTLAQRYVEEGLRMDEHPLVRSRTAPDGLARAATQRTRADTGRIVAALEEKLAAHPGDDDLANGEDRLSKVWRLAPWVIGS
jgi:hypothetical protein